MDSWPLPDEKLVDDYLSVRRRDVLRTGHIYALKKVLKLFLEASNCSSISECLEKFRDGNGLHRVLQIVVSKLSGEGLKPKTILFYLTLLTNFLGFYDVDYHKALKKVRKPKKATVRIDRIPDAAILQKLILVSRSRRFRMLVQLLAQTGMRLSEALNLKVMYIDFKRRIIDLPGNITKNGKPRQIPIINELREALQKYIEVEKLNPESYLFPSKKNPSEPWRKKNVYELWWHALKNLGLDERDEVGYTLHIHCLRKWFKTQLEIANVNRLLIMSWMGHDAGVQAVYFMPSQKDVEKEVEKAEKALTIFGAKSTPIDRLSEEKIKALEEAVQFYESLVDYLLKKNPRLLKKLGLE